MYGQIGKGDGQTSCATISALSGEGSDFRHLLIFDRHREDTMTRRPLFLSIACTLQLFYILLDLWLTFHDSRSDGQAVMFAIILVPAVVLCWRGNHFGYLFSVLLAGFLMFVPFIAKLNAPDRLITGFDVPVSLILLLLYLSPPVLRFMKAQRAAWQQKQQSQLDALSKLRPLFAAGNPGERSVGQLFWQSEDALLIFLGRPLTAYRLRDIEHAEMVRAQLVKYQNSNRMVAIIGMMVMMAGLAGFAWVGLSQGVESKFAMGAVMLVPPLLLSVPLLRMARFQTALKQQLVPTNLKVGPLALLDLYGKNNRAQEQSMKKVALLLGGGMLMLSLILSLTVSPKIMEKRRQQQAEEQQLDGQADSPAVNALKAYLPE